VLIGRFSNAFSVSEKPFTDVASFVTEEEEDARDTGTGEAINAFITAQGKTSDSN